MAEAKAWYNEKDPGVGEDFLDAAERTLQRIRERPKTFESPAKNVHRAMLDRFPYVVYFRILGASNEVLAVVHGHRHPRVWRSRL